MRTRALEFVACPHCAGDLTLHVIESEQVAVTGLAAEIVEELKIDEATVATDVLEGLLLCEPCRLLYPLHDGVARLFTYTLAASQPFLESRKAILTEHLDAGWRLPNGRPAPGEGAVQSSFTKQWQEYDYDGFIWAWTEESRLELALREIGQTAEQLRGKAIADVGSGNGVLSHSFASQVGMEVLGLDLSFAAVQAARHFRSQPLLNFIQGSVFHLPLKRERFDVGYSSGVLHHTYDTKLAFENAVETVRDGGTFYIWLYSSERRGLQGALSIVNDRIRAAVCRLPFPVQNAVIHGLLAPVYWGARATLRPLILDSRTMPYNWRQVVHAARDAYTPLYAHHHSPQEVAGWFREKAFTDVEMIVPYKPAKSRTVPCSVRGRRRSRARGERARAANAAGSVG